jgi:hypothetical protein
MHLLDRYALSCGVKIDKPFILEQYYPIALDKYIVFQTSGKGNSRQYDYWHKVFYFIREYYPDCKIVHVGLPSDQTVEGVDEDLRGRTSIRQLAYVIKNSLLYLGVDSLSAHLAGFYNRKIVSLYSYCYAQNCYPVWGDKKNKSLIEVDWEKHGKPSFSLVEKNKKINTIKPEIIAQNVLDQLAVANDLNKVKSLYFGNHYNDSVIEIIPNELRLPSFIQNKLCNIRMDLHFDEKILEIISRVSHLNIITDKEISIECVNKIKNKIQAVTIEASERITVQYLDQLKSLGIKISLFAKDSERWGELAERFFDFSLEKEMSFTKEDIKNNNEINEDCVFLSEKVFISNGKIYASEFFWKKDLVKLDKHSKIVDVPDFWKEAQHFYFLKDERKNTNYQTNSSR